MEKKKVSAFEYAIMEIADPESAKTHEPYTKSEEHQQRESNLRQQASQLVYSPSPLKENKQ